MVEGASKGIVSPDAVKWIEAQREKYGVPGLAFGVVKGQDGLDGAQQEWSKEYHTFGVRNPRGDPYQEDTIFGIGSCSKQFAALCAALIIHRKTLMPNGRPLTWETKVKDVLGDTWELPDKYATEHCSLNDLSGMKIGLAPHPFARLQTKPHASYAQQLRAIRHLTSSSELRQKFQYDAIAYTAFARIVEVVTGIKYHEYLAVNVFQKLGMQSAHWNSNLVRESGKGTDGFLRSGGDPVKTGLARYGQPVSVGWWTENDGVWILAAGGVSMSMVDAVKYLQALLDPNPETLPSGILQASDEGSSLGPVDFPLRLEPGATTVYGRGQVTTTYRGHEVVWHTGNMPGQVTTMLRVPKANLGFAIAVNDGSEVGGTLMGAVRQRLLDDLLGLSGDEYDAKLLNLGTVPSPQPAITVVPNLSPIGNDNQKLFQSILHGAYWHPSYKSLVIESFDPSTSQARAMIDAAGAKGWKNDLTANDFVTSSGGYWLSHLLFRPLGIWNDQICLLQWYAYQVYAVPNEKGEKDGTKRVATLRGTGRAVCTEGGLGMFDGFWDMSTNKRVPVPEDLAGALETLESTAEVWFARVF